MINVKRVNFRCKCCGIVFTFENEWRKAIDDIKSEQSEADANLEVYKILRRHMCVDCYCELENSVGVRERIDKDDGKFYCEKCRIRTDDKTPDTKCVICGSFLVRMGGGV